MEQLLLHLRNLGFTEMESKIMVELATKGQAWIQRSLQP